MLDALADNLQDVLIPNENYNFDFAHITLW